MGLMQWVNMLNVPEACLVHSKCSITFGYFKYYYWLSILSMLGFDVIPLCSLPHGYKMAAGLLAITSKSQAAERRDKQGRRRQVCYLYQEVKHFPEISSYFCLLFLGRTVTYNLSYVEGQFGKASFLSVCWFFISWRLWMGRNTSSLSHWLFCSPKKMLTLSVKKRRTWNMERH